MTRTTILGCLTALTLLAISLRVAFLGYTFVSSDDIELAHRVLLRDGYGWMIEEHYGVLISLLVKLHAKLAVALGVTLTEFWWRLPVALAGASLVPASFLAMRGMGSSTRASFIAAGFMAVLPIHVFHSRYLWGYEAIGAVCAVVAVAALIRFFARPDLRRGITSGLLCALYLVSHGYILPFFGVLLLVPALLCDLDEPNPLRRCGRGLKLYFTKGVFVPIVLAAPIYRYAIEHALEKRTRFGFYGLHYGGEVLQNLGLFLVVLVIVAAIVFLVSWRRSQSPLPRDREGLVVLALGGIGVGYLLPIFLMTPPGITLTRNYLILGPMFLVLAAVAVFDRRELWGRGWARGMAALVTLLTGWGSFESYYSLDSWIDPSMVRWERGALLPDPGSKALGYIVRTVLPADAKVLYIHRKMEPPNVGYYCGMERPGRSFYDRSLLRSRSDFERSEDWAEYVIADPQQVGFFEASNWRLLYTLTHGETRLAMVFGRSADSSVFDRLPTSFAELNRRFDHEFAPGLRGLVDRPFEAGGISIPAAPR